MSEIHVKDENSELKYFTILPNLLSRLELTAFERSVYWAVKECAGEKGSCTKSYVNLAKAAGMSVTSLKKTLKSLSEPNKITKKPLILIKNRSSEFGDKDTNEIVLVDIWTENLKIFKKNIGQSPRDLPQSPKNLGKASRDRGVSRHATEGQSPRDYKEEPLNNNLMKKNCPPTPDSDFVIKKQAGGQAAFFIYPILKDIPPKHLSQHQKKILSKFPEEKVKRGLEYAANAEIRTNLYNTLKWFCELPENEEPKGMNKVKNFEINQKLAKSFQESQNDKGKYDICSTYCEIAYFTQCAPKRFDYDQDCDKFAQSLKTNLRAMGLG